MRTATSWHPADDDDGLWKVDGRPYVPPPSPLRGQRVIDGEHPDRVLYVLGWTDGGELVCRWSNHSRGPAVIVDLLGLRWDRGAGELGAWRRESRQGALL